MKINAVTFCLTNLGNGKPIFNLDDHDIPGVPDGMTIDTDGNLWVAVFDGGCLLHINPNTSQLLKTIKFPAKQVSTKSEELVI